MIKQFCILTMLLGCCFVSKVGAETKKEVYITRIGDIVTIGNEYLAREFSLADGKVRTQMIENKRTGKNPIRIIPGPLSEEFVIRTLGPDSVTVDIC